jgi:hypothetical protein
VKITELHNCRHAAIRFVPWHQCRNNLELVPSLIMLVLVNNHHAQLALPVQIFDLMVKAKLQAAITVPLDLKATLMALKCSAMSAAIPQRGSREVGATCHSRQSQFKRF